MGYLMPSKIELPIQPATLETVDTGFYDVVDKSFNIHAITNNGFVKVPVLWLGTERAFQLKSDKDLRDSHGRLKLPIITIERTSLAKDPSFKGPIQADIRPIIDGSRDYKGGAFRIVSRVNQEKTSNIQAANNLRNRSPKQVNFPAYGTSIVFDEYYIPVPTYVAVTYSITIRSEYQQQMNQMVAPFITRTGQLNHFVFKKDNHKFEAFIQQDFAADNNLASMGEEARTFKTKIDVKVLGYLIGEGINEDRPKVVKRETIVTLSAPIEVVLSSAEIAGGRKFESSPDPGDLTSNSAAEGGKSGINKSDISGTTEFENDIENNEKNGGDTGDAADESEEPIKTVDVDYIEIT